MAASSASWRAPPATCQSVEDPLPSNTVPMLATRKKKGPETPFVTPDQMVTFEIGPDKQKFLIHKEIACQASPVFEKAFNSNFEEGQTQTYKLEDVEPDTFRFFSKWMYSQKLSLLEHDIDTVYARAMGEDDQHSEKCVMQDYLLAELWILGDRLFMKSLQNYVMQDMVATGHACGSMDYACLPIIYRNTLTGSPLRRLVVDQYAWGSVPLSARATTYPPEMLLELAELYYNAAPKSVKSRKLSEIVEANYLITEEEEGS
ncbi:hypothetical protein LOCC1_G007767 [Lachnellula occidentalis]|uniref:BTB domain-containing protein n=1 Tax=Lachnellula occidentalis TaxID=215460 RepID=A0A8H8UF68_9HELO|nr:hypothetical protein LOCC1_G007767 [Lachnellula occidentalis]